ncbi:MAG: response regulator transcription factor [Opitutaceae bacterium]|nr:response regulator transcription factor [Opitutaceae bacterium]
MKVLIVEDQAKLGRFLRRGLNEQGWTATWVQTAAAAQDALCDTKYEVVVLDLMLPDRDGMDLLREWRKFGFNEPVIILSARNAVKDRVQGLEVGADDYLPKPFSLEELVARIRALGRRQSTHKDMILEHGELKLDLLARTVTWADQPITLTARELALLEIFLQNIGRILTRSLLMEKVWESHYDVDPNLLDVYMSRLRSKFDPLAKKPLFETVRGIGYKMV